MEVSKEIVSNSQAAESFAPDIGSVINIRHFLQSWDQEALNLSVRAPQRNKTTELAHKMGISEDLVEELSAVCSVDTLLCGEEPADKGNLLKMKKVPKSLDLTCVRYQERDLERRKMVDYKLYAMNKMKYRMLDVLKIPPDPYTHVDDQDRVPVPNVVLTIKICRPRLKSAFLPKGEVFQVLGTHFLTDLKDRISCVKDDAIAGEFSNFPNYPNEQLTPAKQIYKSGMFFIENTFYNDMREADNRDYSEPVMRWARENQHDSWNIFKKAKMEATQFLDIKVQLGVPYLYQHQGNCEHIIVFTDLRLLHPDDPPDIHHYPYLLSETVARRTICRACQMDSAKWVIYESQLCPESPCFMCHNCFILLHYDQKEEKICDFKAYKYKQKVLSHF